VRTGVGLGDSAVVTATGVRRDLRRTVPALLRACHPEPTAGVTSVFGLLALTAGAGWRTVPVVLAVGANQLSIGWDNDALDAERDRRAGRTDKPAAAGAVSPRLVRRAAVLAATACVPLSASLGWRAALANLTCVGAGWAYNHGLKATRASPVPYLVGFGALAAVVPLAVGVRVPAWLVAAGSLLGAAAHFANVVPDIEVDLSDGIRGLPQRLGAGRSRAAFAGLLVSASAVLAFGPGGGAVGLTVVVVAAGVVLAGVLAARRPGSRALFRSAIVVAVLDVVLLVVSGGSVR